MKLKFWQREKKESRTGLLIGAGFPGGTVWSDKNYASFAKETYMKNVIAYRCIDYISKSVSSVPYGLFRTLPDGEREQDFNHSFNNVLIRANPKTSWMMLVYAHISYFCMSGNAYMERVKPDSGPNRTDVKELYTLRPDRMQIKVNESTGQISGYVYTLNGQDIVFDVDPITLESDIMHMKTFNPLNDFYGMATTEPAARKIDTSNSMDNWNKSLTDNYGRPGLLFMYENELGDEQYKRLKENLKKEVSGSVNAGKNLILEGIKDAKPYGWTPAELDWIKSNLELARSICIAWGVAPQLIGIPDTTTYANYQEARTAFWEETALWYIQFFTDEMDAWLFPEQELQFDYMLDDVPAFQYKRDKKWERAEKSNFITTNEKRTMVGYDPIEGGDVVLVPANMIPLGMDVETEDDIEEEDEEARQALLNQGLSDEEVQSLMEV